MKAMKLICSLFVLPFLLGCEDEGNLPEVDPQLVGDWYYVNTVLVGGPSPNITFHGMHIAANKTIQSLGIEIGTGKAALMEDMYPKELLQATAGVLIVQSFAPPDFRVDTSLYRVDQNILTLTGRYTSSLYSRTQLGTILGTPIQSTLSVMIDSTEFRSPSVASYPPAFVSRTSNSLLWLYAEIPGGWITIGVDNFAGTGSYLVGTHKGSYTQILGDVRVTFFSDSSSTNTITIDQYNEASKQCSGRFGFTVEHYTPSGDPPLVRWLHDGVFSVPVYR
jgi:hypothetical protein